LELSAIRMRRRETRMAVVLTAATALSGTVTPCSRLMPLPPMKARSSTRVSSIATAQWSTAPRVSARTRPPMIRTVISGRPASGMAVASEGVTTVIGRSAGRCSPTSMGRKPSSR
jgi:hypothetical protein